MLSSGAEVCIQADGAQTAREGLSSDRLTVGGSNYTGPSVFPATALEPPKPGPTPEDVSIGLA